MEQNLLAGMGGTFWKKGRLETYTQWPFKADGDICTPERMAAAGFFVVGGEDDPDSVECFICGKQLDGWEASDDPWQEHVKHKKDCPFVLLNKQDETQWTIDDLIILFKVYKVKECTRHLGELVKNLKLKSQILAKEIPKIYKQERKSRK